MCSVCPTHLMHLDSFALIMFYEKCEVDVPPMISVHITSTYPTQDPVKKYLLSVVFC